MQSPTTRRMAAAATAALLMLAAYGGPARACACCTNEGQRMVETVKMDAYSAGIFADIRFAETARLYTGERDLTDIEGVTAKSSDLRLAVKKGEKSWEFAFAEDGGGGTLTFVLPGSVTKFEVDPRDPDVQPNGLGPVLYKEWRLTSVPRGTGMFRAATGGDWRATLILHGRGIGCTDVAHFNAWTLVLHGSKGTSSLFGTLSPQ